MGKEDVGCCYEGWSEAPRAIFRWKIPCWVVMTMQDTPPRSKESEITPRVPFQRLQRAPISGSRYAKPFDIPLKWDADWCTNRWIKICEN